LSYNVPRSQSRLCASVYPHHSVLPFGDMGALRRRRGGQHPFLSGTDAMRANREVGERSESRIPHPALEMEFRCGVSWIPTGRNVTSRSPGTWARPSTGSLPPIKSWGRGGRGRGREGRGGEEEGLPTLAAGGAVSPCLSCAKTGRVSGEEGEGWKEEEARRRPAWVEESPKLLKIAVEIIPAPSQNSKRRLCPAKGPAGGARAKVTGEPLPQRPQSRPLRWP
jgi:hypothetical protein